MSDAVIHSIVIRPNPTDDDEKLGHEYNKAIIQIFKRLNTTGKALNAQEVRASIFHGELLDLLQELNVDENWRILFGNVHSRMKDQEAILRVLALQSDGGVYKSPMPKFLDNFMEKNRHLAEDEVVQLKIRFKVVLKIIRQALGNDILKRRGTFVLTKFDALFIGMMSALDDQPGREANELEEVLVAKFGELSIEDRLETLEADRRGLDEEGNEIEAVDGIPVVRGYVWSVAKFTNDKNRVEARLNSAREVFAVE